MTVLMDGRAKTDGAKTRLMDLSDEAFRDLVDRELRKDHPSTPESERVELNGISEQFRRPAVIDRWISVLTIMKTSSETQLGARRSDLRKTYGTITDEEYQARRRAYESWRAGNVRFLHSVQQRLIEARSVKEKALVETLLDAIETHRATTLGDDYDPTDADEALWSVVPKE